MRMEKQHRDIHWLCKGCRPKECLSGVFHKPSPHRERHPSNMTLEPLIVQVFDNFCLSGFESSEKESLGNAPPNTNTGLRGL